MITTDANLLASSAAVNRSAATLTLDAATIADAAGAEQPSGAVANITSVQRMTGAPASVTTMGGASVELHGNLADSTVSASGNQTQAVATGNLVTSNRLAVTGSTIDANGGSSSQGHGAGVTASGNADLGAAFGVQNIQDYGASAIGATLTGGTATITAGGTVTDSSLTTDSNATLAAATGNRAINAVSAGGASSTGLANSQTSIAQVAATATSGAGYAVLAPPTPIAVTGSTILIDGNVTTALARGNVAENSMDLASGAAGLLGTATVDSATRTVESSAALLNGQTNYGAVLATATGRGYVPLNAPSGGAENAVLTASGNSIAASAYGNAATNRMTVSALDQTPGAAIGNFQSNAANLTALVTGSGVYADLRLLQAGTLSITGNSLAATAVDNQATSLIATPR